MSSPAANRSLELPCPACGRVTRFDQPYPYHAGFGNQGFLYNDTGDLTLVWDSYDKAYRALMGPVHPFGIEDPAVKAAFEDVLLPAPRGGRWRFRNPARCPHCAGELSGPMEKTIQFLRYPGSPAITSFHAVLIADCASLVGRVPPQQSVPKTQTPEERRMIAEAIRESRARSPEDRQKLREFLRNRRAPPKDNLAP